MYLSSCFRAVIIKPLAVGMQTVRMATDCTPRLQVPYEIFVRASTNTNMAKVTLNNVAPEELNLFKLKTYFMYCTTSSTFGNSVFCPQCICVLRGSQNKQRFFSLYRINLPDFITECLLRGTNWVFNSDTVSFLKA
jgi:hypothetical protein